MVGFLLFIYLDIVIFIFLLPAPYLFTAFTTELKEPVLEGVPVIFPVLELIFKPAGNLLAE